MRQSKKSDPNTYTKPELRDRIKDEVMAGDKGGDPGQWSARKAQVVKQEYEHKGGGYKKPRNETQKSLRQWGDEHWTTADRQQARRPGGTARYLPEKAWDQLSAEEKASTDEKKRKGSRNGKQFVANTAAAVTARKKATAKSAASGKSAPVKRKPGSKKTAKHA